ncbi:MAG: hypothetical protein BWY10_02184 [Chloroflexi bacterium ADurb.Bin180]|nr:MAG: hypothetical protein BWY10_02184 [Chloroflexi bacterium ADurb.Bin180]HNR97277.1 YraN family protein [Anaerolineae bacterium]
MVESARVVNPVANARQRLGKLGEDLAARHLQREGYVILTRNYRCAEGEMDIVARQGSRLAFVEVRTRRGSAYGTPKESITRSKQERLVRIACDYLSAHDLHDVDWGIDAVSVVFTPGGELGSIELLRNAVLGLG